ncbi:MAG: hypothetical protein M1821_005470 [Bathelium mastoideum]|nr:MAG: hypothetical protein M1821_005470 [Bathelium mastoideum]
MSQPSSEPSLTPQFCFNQTALRELNKTLKVTIFASDFLRLSRATIDDSISQNLNALLTPARDPFDPTKVSSQLRNPPPGRRQIPTAKCQTFADQVLFPSWQVRSDVLTYCASVATSPDPDDPDAILREVENAKAREQVVDERLDPYSARWSPREARTEMLAGLVRNERGVEKINGARMTGSWEQEELKKRSKDGEGALAVYWTKVSYLEMGYCPKGSQEVTEMH